MIDKAHALTDDKLEALEKKIRGIYSRAGEELEKKSKSYFKDFEKEDKRKRELVEQGKLSPTQYQQWQKEETMTGRRYADLQKQISEEMLHANETAIAYANGELPAVYALNYNQLAKEVDGVGGYSFTLVDEQTVKNLSLGDEDLLPYKEMNKIKDVNWNKANVNSEILQGILQGESIPEIAERLRKIGNRNLASALINARTMITSAENKGRLDSYKQAEKDGVIMKKEWVSSDQPGRTRDWHMPGAFDSLIVEIDEPFRNSVGTLMYPGDPSAHPSNVRGCRCTMIAKIEGFKKVTK